MSTLKILTPAEIRSISVDAPSETKIKFSDTWPACKESLLLLIKLVKNPILKMIIGAIISTGEALAGVGL